MRRANKRSFHARKRTQRVRWSSADLRQLRTHSKSRTPVVKISKVMKRTAGALRQKAQQLGIPLGHRR